MKTKDLLIKIEKFQMNKLVFLKAISNVIKSGMDIMSALKVQKKCNV